MIVILMVFMIGDHPECNGAVIKETRSCTGTMTGNTINYTVNYPEGALDLPVLLHQYGNTDKTLETNERIAGYGVFCVSVGLKDTHCGYGLQDYKDAIEDVFKCYDKLINKENVTIMGASYGGATVYGMAVHFPYLFDQAIPVFGISDFGFDDNTSWWVLIEKNSPTWDPLLSGMPGQIGDRITYHDTRYMVRNAIFGAKNNPYAHFEILHDADDGVGKTGVQVQLSRRYVAELDRLGYANYRYTETPKAGFLFPKDDRFPIETCGQPIRYVHSWIDKSNPALYHFELYTLKDSLLGGKWKRPAFQKNGQMFVPSFLETPYFRFDLGEVVNNCDEAADITYDVSTPTQYSFNITARTKLTCGKLCLMQLSPNATYALTAKETAVQRQKTDDQGIVTFTLLPIVKGGELRIIVSNCSDK
jgi:hypothetical protein